MTKGIPAYPQNSFYTKSQWEAIHSGGSDILVSASAGSGKTRVLVDRVIEKIKKGSEIDRLLIVTFTRAAAQEMKERILTALQKEVNESSGDQRNHYIRQITKLPQANISTIHSFCREIIQRFYYLTDMDPNSRQLSDDTEIALLKETVWDELREELLSSDNEAIQEVFEMYSGDRNSNSFTDIIMSMHNMSISHPDPEAWLSSLNHLYEVDEENFEETLLFNELIQPQILSELEYGIDILNTAKNLVKSERGIASMVEILDQDLEFFKELVESIAQEKVERAYELIHTHKWPQWKVPKDEDDTRKDFVRDIVRDGYRNKAKNIIDKTLKNDYFFAPVSTQIYLLEEMREPVATLAKITDLFNKRYAEYKKERQLIDFNDLEHRSLEILNTKEEEVYVACEYYRRFFEEVLIDEYQDTSILQEEILKKVAYPEAATGNRFMVGDVKQSIYRFRQAEPQLFIEKFLDFKGEESGERVILLENFRSRKEILSFVNLLFTQLMDEEVGEIDYDESQALIKGDLKPDYPDGEDFETELLIYETDDELEEDLFPDSTEGEINLLALKIKSMIENEKTIYDKATEENRPVNYSDFVVLTRTKQHNLKIQSIFQEYNIPVSVNETQNYFQTTEVTTMMSVLKMIDNPYQDIPTAAVLRSPIVGLKENELAEIRIANKESDYFTALLTYMEANKGNPTSPKLYKTVSDFLDQLSGWRDISERITISELIWRIYSATGYLDFVAGMPGGKQRKANLHALYERAQVFERTEFKGLYRFIQFIERMQERDNDLSEPSALSAHENAVRVMTTHASKGLQFPIVILFELSKQITGVDYQGDVLLDKNYGIATKYIDAGSRIKAKTLAHTGLKNEIQRKAYSEEMRILYVALTRAEQKLILIGRYDNAGKAVQEWSSVSSHTETTLPISNRLGGKQTMLDWVGSALIRYSEIDGANNILVNRGEVSPFRVSFYGDEAMGQLISEAVGKEKVSWYDSFRKGDLQLAKDEDIGLTNELLEKSRDLMNYEYPHKAATHTTSYQSVSEIKRLFEDPDLSRLVQFDERRPQGQNRYVIDELERPKFISEVQVPTPAEIGMATHLVLQVISFQTLPGRKDIQDQIDKLVANGSIHAEVAAYIDVEKLVQFFETALAERMTHHEETLERELSFSLKIPANRIYPDIPSDDQILIHGIADGIFQKDDGSYVLFDYKTDKVTRYGDQAAEAMLSKYRGQLNLYQIAIESILDVTVSESYLVLLDNTEIVPVTIKN